MLMVSPSACPGNITNATIFTCLLSCPTIHNPDPLPSSVHNYACSSIFLSVFPFTLPLCCNCFKIFKPLGACSTTASSLSIAATWLMMAKHSLFDVRQRHMSPWGLHRIVAVQDLPTSFPNCFHLTKLSSIACTHQISFYWLGYILKTMLSNYQK